MQQIWTNLMIVNIMSYGKKFKKRENILVLESALWQTAKCDCESENNILGNIS